MSVTWPLTGLIEAARLASAAFNLSWGQEQARQASGVVTVKDLRPALWQARFETREMTHAMGLQLQARIASLDGSVGTFEAWNPIAAYPQADPDGSVLDAAEVAIKSVGSNGKSLALKGLPAAYVLTAGDFLAFDYGAGPSRALHQVVEGATANGSGDTAEFEVRPHVRTGAAADDEIVLVRPAAIMRLVPGSLEMRTASRLFVSARFEAIQVL